MADQAREVPTSPDRGQYKGRSGSALRRSRRASALAPAMDTSRHLLRRRFQMHERILKIPSRHASRYHRFPFSTSNDDYINVPHGRPDKAVPAAMADSAPSSSIWTPLLHWYTSF